MIQPPNGIDEIRRVYGDLKIDTDPRGGYRIISPVTWEVVNMTTLHELPGLPGRKLYVNKQIVGPLLHALTNWQSKCPEYEIKSIGCFCPRPKRRNGRELSGHAWGVCLDINPATNPMRTYIHGERIICDMPAVFIECWESVGWKWGGRWRPTADAMHFQYFSGY